MNSGLILVTGASGFVGKVLCSELTRRGLKVRGAVRNQVELTSVGQVFTVGDIDGVTDWSEVLRGVDTIIHLAARVHVMKDVAEDPLAAFRLVNTAGTVNLARQASSAGVKRLVYVSSIKVNGEGTHGLQQYLESDPPNPRDPYGISKLEAEQALWQVSNETGLEVVIVRPPLVYGPGVKGNFISLFRAVDKGIPLPLAGAKNARSLVYVGNLVDMLIVCAAHPSAAGNVYLISDGKAVSTATLVRKIAEVLGQKDRSFYFPPLLIRLAAAILGRSAQVDRLFGSLMVNDEKSHLELAWFAPYSLEQGLKATAEWYRDSKSAS